MQLKEELHYKLAARMKNIAILFTIVLLGIIIACSKEGQYIDPTIHDIDIENTSDFLFNVPINYDSVFIDVSYGIDFRIEIEGYTIDSVEIIIDETYKYKYNTTIINSKSFFSSEGIHQIEFKIRTINNTNGNIEFFRSAILNLVVIRDLSYKFVSISNIGGKLNITWPELDKKNTQKYLIERFMGKSFEYSQEFDIHDSTYIDDYYVGEEVNFKISVINTDGNKQNIWYYKKQSEQPSVTVSQHPSGGYNIHYSQCKYYNNFGQYYLTTGTNYNPELLFSSEQVKDTIYHISDAKFADDARFWLRYLPKQYPFGISDEDWMLYGKFLYTRYGNKNFKYDRIAILNSEYIVYTIDGNIFKRKTDGNQIIDSIINENTNYGFLRTTPTGNYIYAADKNTYDSPVFFWLSNSFSENPEYTFNNDFIIPPVSDNLIAIMDIPSNEVPSKLALYNVINGNILYTTDYNATGNKPTISSNGQYFFIDDSDLKLCSYINNSFDLIWEESDWTKYYRFYDFNPLNDGICYVWDDDKNFSTRNTSNFSELNSFPLELDKIINIDYYSNRIMGYVTDKILIFNLENGTLEEEIPANLRELFLYSNNAILLGNIIYSNHGIKYILSE